MADKQTLKKGQARIGVTRSQGPSPDCIFARSFQIREDHLNGALLDIVFEPISKGTPSRRVLFDLSMFAVNRQSFEEYAAKLEIDVDDTAQVENAVYPQEIVYANVCFAGHVAHRSELCFCLLSFNDWADSSRKIKAGEDLSVLAGAVLSVYGSVSFQKKLISEMLRLSLQS